MTTARAGVGCALLAVVLIAGGCSSKSSAGRPTPQCSSVSTSQIQNDLKVTVEAPKQAKVKSITTCTYAAATGVGQVVVDLNPGISEATFQEAVGSLNDVTPVDGIGNAGYSYPSSRSDPAQNTVAVLNGTTEISVVADAAVDALETLAKDIIAHS